MITRDEILVGNGLDFNISKRPLIDVDGNESGYFGLFNDKSKKCIHTVKGGYYVAQNAEIVDLVLEGISGFGTDLRVQKAGSLNGGRKVYIQLAITGDTLLNGDTIKRYVTIIDSNDGTASFSTGIGDLTMSCANQFYQFSKLGTKLRHNSSLEAKLKMLPSMLNESLETSFRQAKLYRELAEVEVGEFQVHEIVNKVLGFDKKITSVLDLSEKSTRSINKMNELYAQIEIEVADKGLNAWGLHSGVTRFTTHSQSVPKRDNGRSESLMLGSAYKLNMLSMNYVKKRAGIFVPSEDLVLS